MSTKEKLEHPKALAHGIIQKLFDDVWFVQGAVKMPMLLPMKISHSMTIVKNPENNALTLVNAMRLSEDGLQELAALGKVANVLRIGGYHGKDDGYYRERFGAKIYAIKGQVYTRKMDTTTNVDDGYLQPDYWLEEGSALPINAATLKILKTPNPVEALVLLEKEGGILITGDSLQNTPAPDRFVNFPARIMMKKMGFYKQYNVGPAWLQFAKPQLSEVRAILDLNFSHVLPGHGDPVIGDAKEKYRPVLEGELKGCHTK